MKVAVLGGGRMGGSLAQRLVRAGYDLTMGVRSLQSPAVSTLIETLPGGVAFVPPEEALLAGEVVFLALPAHVILTLYREWPHPERRVVIDCSNPVDWQDGPRVREELQVPETLRRHWVDARLVKAFNTVGSAQVLHPTVNGQPIDLFLCGDDEEAKETVSRLGTGLGFHPVDSGPLRNAPLLEHLAVLLMSLSAHSFRGRSITLKLEAE